MATDQRRFEVFVSSTYRDLQDARQRVTMTLLECDAFPSGMEIFPAADDDAWTLIRRIIDRCDYYLLVIAGKYGSIDPSSGLSYTEMEYDYALTAGKPVMAFLYKDIDSLRADQCETTDDGREKLNNFRHKVQKAKHVKYWKSLDDLPGQVALSYTKFVRDYPATGWMRADLASSAESLKELLDAKARVEELEDALTKANTTAPSGAEDLAQGSDEFEVSYQVSAFDESEYITVEHVVAWRASRPTWDSLFATVAPSLLQEAEESVLRKLIESFLLLEYFDDNKAALLQEAKRKKLQVGPKGFSNWGTHISGDDFGTIMVQLTALGLIEQSERKRSGAYWTLTPFGKARTVQLRAIKKLTAGPSSVKAAAD